jgi:hypothetical protein
MQSTPSGRTKVLYIAGTARCGSTLLDRVLGELPDFLSAGELNLLWQRGLVQGEPCSCGHPVRECGFWQAVFGEAFGGFDGIDPRTMARGAGPTSDVLGRLYAALAHVSQRRVIVDSSKRPSYAQTLSSAVKMDVYVVHLVRDSRAVVHSLLKRKVRFAGDEGAVYMGMQSTSPLLCSWRWARVNTRSERLRGRGFRYLRMRYEEFTADPGAALELISAFVGEPLRTQPLAGGHTINLSGNHAASGNPMRFDTGPVEILADQAWRREQRLAQRCAVTAMTWPLLLRYGYSIGL